MTYELLYDGRGVMTDRTPVMGDIKDTYEVSFLLPAESSYVAMFRDAQDVEYRKTIKDGVVKLPKELLRKEQYVGLVVSETDGEKVIRSWLCEPLRISSFFNMRLTQWQLSGGMTDKGAYERMTELEQAHAQTLEKLDALQAEYAQAAEQFNTVVSEQTTALEAVRTENERLTNAYNSLIVVVNELTEKVAALEKNYDPTVIE